MADRLTLDPAAVVLSHELWLSELVARSSRSIERSIHLLETTAPMVTTWTRRSPALDEG